MRMLILILFGLSSLSLKTFASTGNAGSVALAAVAITGTSVAISKTAHDSLIARELKDWKEGETDSTVRLYNQCQSNLELRLLGNHRLNALFVTIKNESEANYIIRPSRISMTFGKKKRRLANFPQLTSDVEIKSGWYGHYIVPFPKKSDFKNEDVIDVSIPIYRDSLTEASCVITGEINRDQSIEPLEKTYSYSLVLDMALEFGVGIGATSDTKNIHKEGKFNFILDLNLIPWGNHGIGMGLHGADTNDDLSLLMSQNINDGRKAVDLSLNGFYFGYTYRKYLNDKWLLNFGLGFYNARYSDLNIDINNDAQRDLGSKGGYYGRVGIEYTYARLLNGFWNGDYLVGLTLFNRYLPDHLVGGIEAGGTDHSLLLSFRMGI